MIEKESDLMGHCLEQRFFPHTLDWPDAVVREEKGRRGIQFAIIPSLLCSVVSAFAPCCNWLAGDFPPMVPIFPSMQHTFMSSHQNLLRQPK